VTVAIVTGGAWDVARELARSGCAVVLVYLAGRLEAETAVDDIVGAGGVALGVRADITDELDVERLFDETVAAYDGVDLVVHTSAGDTSVIDRHAERWLRQPDGGSG
jgi:NAD(P)-dependent dehydrogenase (short-subunit alcohol dehydrogenase family)